MDLQNFFPFEVIDSENGMRLDQCLRSRFTEVSRARWTRLIEEGLFLIGEKPLSPSTRLKTGQIITLSSIQNNQNTESLKEPEGYVGPIPRVVYEDASLLVIDKPVGLAVHPGSGVALKETLVSWLLNSERIKITPAGDSEFLCWDDRSLEEMRPGIVHRLDRGTSGLLVIAKHPLIHQKLAEQFSQRTAGRMYQAVVMGSVNVLLHKRPQRLDYFLQKDPSPLALRLDENKVSFVSYIDRDPANRLRFRVAPAIQGKKAITHFSQKTANSQYSLLELKLETGRTHQIRVHLSFLGFPILGDTLYQGTGYSRIMLHARQLSFFHPEKNKIMTFESDWPENDLDWLKSENLA